MKKIRVRYAPSPTGQLHIGGARTALFNYLFAKKYKGDFILRIEDTDIVRNISTGEDLQIDNLEWLGINIDESPRNPNKKYGPYRQSERLDIYSKYSKQLLESKQAYFCYCTIDELLKEREEQLKSKVPPRYSRKCVKLSEEEKSQKTNKPSIRISVPLDKEFKWKDVVRGNVSISGKEFGDWVIVKNNGIPTYNFAVAIDDHLMEITHVFRGEEHTSNTPKQLHLFELFGWEAPIYGHMTLIVNAEGKKLSKRDESAIQFIEQYKNMGYIPGAVFNFLALLGWSPNGEEEKFSKEELCSIFDPERLSKSPSTFDVNKLEWMNSVYMKELKEEEFMKLVKPFAVKKYKHVDFEKENNIKIINLFRREVKYGSDINNKLDIFFSEFKKEKDAIDFLEQTDNQDVINDFTKKIKNCEWTIEGITSVINDVKQTTNKKGKDLFMPIRIACSGQTHGPDLKETILFISKDEILKRLA